jgi:hypothetical protein
MNAIDVFDRDLPHDVTCEKRVIAALLIYPLAKASRSIDRLDIDDFYLGAGEINGWIFLRIMSARNRDEDFLRHVMASQLPYRFRSIHLAGYLARLIVDYREDESLYRCVTRLKSLRRHRERIDTHLWNLRAVWLLWDDARRNGKV